MNKQGVIEFKGRVADVVDLRRPLQTISPGETVAAASVKMSTRDVGCLLVVNEQGKMSGILSERDVVRRMVAYGRDPARVAVGEVMTRDLLVCRLDTPAGRARQVMAERRLRHLPVVEDGKPIGLISSRELLDHMQAMVKGPAKGDDDPFAATEREHTDIRRLRTDTSGRIIIGRSETYKVEGS